QERFESASTDGLPTIHLATTANKPGKAPSQGGIVCGLKGQLRLRVRNRAPNQGFDSVCSVADEFVFPYNDECPSCLFEPSLSVHVPGDVAIELCLPPFAVGLWLGSVLG